MKHIQRQHWLALSAFALVSSAQAADAVDASAPFFETEIEWIDRLPGKFGWIDANTLLATTYGNADNDFAIRKVVAFDVITQTTKTLVEFGSIECINADKGLLSVLTGTLEKGYKGGSKAADPVSKFFSWNARQSTLTVAGTKFEGAWNHYLCLPTSKEDIGVVSFPFQDTRNLYLQPEHGSISVQFPSGSDNAAQPLMLSRNGAPPKKLNANIEDITQVPEYLPFMKSYLLSAGTFLSGGAHFVHGNGAPYTEVPMLLLTPSGELSRVAAPKELQAQMKGLAKAVTLPKANGSLVIVDSTPTQGGGIYTVSNSQIQRVWCTPEKAFNAEASCGFKSPLAVSPDGCKVAFFSDFIPKPAPRRYHPAPTLKIVNVCSAR